jgi:hypothetical protein
MALRDDRVASTTSTLEDSSFSSSADDDRLVCHQMSEVKANT